MLDAFLWTATGVDAGVIGAGVGLAVLALLAVVLLLAGMWAVERWDDLTDAARRRRYR